MLKPSGSSILTLYFPGGRRGDTVLTFSICFALELFVWSFEQNPCIFNWRQRISILSTRTTKYHFTKNGSARRSLRQSAHVFKIRSSV